MTSHGRNGNGGGQLDARELRARVVRSFRFTRPGLLAVPIGEAVRDPDPVYLTALPDGFTGRGWLIDQIDSFLAGQPCGYVWIEADAGTGKTALAAHLARERGWVSHFARHGGGSVRAALLDLAGQVIVHRELRGLAPGGMLPEWAGTPEGFEALLTRAAHGDRLVVLVDGVERAVTPQGWLPSGLPRVLPPNVFVVGTYRTGTPAPLCDVPSVVIRVAADDERNRADLLDHLRSRGHSDDLAERCGGVWAYARYVLDEIRPGSRQAADLDEPPGDPRSCYAGRLDRWRGDDDWQDLALPVLATLVVAREPLPLETLSRLSGVDERAVQEWCDLRLRPFLVAGATTPRTFEIHDAGAREVWAELLPSAVAEAHSRLADHCLAHLDDDYSLRHLAAHLMGAQRLADLEALLREEKDGELVWLAAHDEAGTLDEWSAAVTAVREHHEQLTDEALRRGRLAPMLVLELHYQLVRTSLRSRGGTITPRLLEIAAATGVWSPQRVLAQLRRLQDPDDQIAAMALVVPHLPEDRRAAVVARAMALAETGDQPSRWRAMGTLVPHLSDEDINRHFLRVVAKCDEDFAITAFERIVPHLPVTGIDRALRVAKWLALQGGEHRPLAAIAPRLSESQAETALDVAASITDGAKRFEVLAGLIPCLPVERRQDAVSSAVEASDAALPSGVVRPSDTLARARRMLVLAPHLPGEHLDRLSTVVSAVADDEDRAPLMVEAARHLPDEGRREVIAQVLKWTFSAHHTEKRAALLVALAQHVDLDALLDIIDRISSYAERAEMLGELAPVLAPDQLTRALRSAEAISDGPSRAKAVAELAVHLPSADERASLAAQALAILTRTSGESTAARTKAALAAHLPAPGRDLVLDEVLEVFEATRDEHLLPPVVRLLTDDQFARLLAAGGSPEAEHVARHGPVGLLPRVLDEVATWKGMFFAQTMEKLAQHLRPGQAHRMAAVATTFDDAEARGRALCALGPHLPSDEQEAAASAALAALTDKQDPNESYLVKLLPQLRVEELDELLAVAHGLTGRRRGAQLLRGLALTMPADRLPRIRGLADTLTTKPDRGSVLNAVLSRLSPDERAHLCEEEVEAAATDDHPYTILMWLAAFLPHHLHAKALGIVRALGPINEAGTGVLRDLAPHLSEADLEDAVAIARTARHDRVRVAGLAHLVPVLPEQRRAEVFGEVLTPDLPLDLVPHLSASELARACGVMDLRRDTVAKALLARAAELGEHQLYVRILRIVWQLNDRNLCLAVLNDCLPVLRDLAGLELGPRLLESLDDVHRWWP